MRESLVFVEDMHVILFIKLSSGQAHTVAPVVSKTILALAFKMHTVELWHMDTCMRQTFWDGVRLGPRDFQYLWIPDLAPRFWSRALA